MPASWMRLNPDRDATGDDRPPRRHVLLVGHLQHRRVSAQTHATSEEAEVE